MGLIQEFKKFAMRGNVVDMAVGVVIGGAFGKIVSSLVNDVIMPPLGMLMGDKGFKDMFIWLGEAAEKPESLALAQESGKPFIGYGSFLQISLDFLIVAMAIFIMIKIMNKAQEMSGLAEEKKDETPPPPPEDIQLLREIRDSLKK